MQGEYLPLGLRRFPINGNAQILANSVASMSVEITASAKNECVPPWFALGVNSLTLYFTLLIVVFYGFSTCSMARNISYITWGTMALP